MAVQKVNPIGALVSLGILAFGAWYMLGGGVEQHVADDAVKQYEIAKRDGAQMDVCVHAGLVSAAYIQAKDEENYRKWKQIENDECARAGVPNQ
jgi:hypothetical protein